jgi:hypothetical protein
VLVDACRSRPMFGNATLTTVASRNAIPEPSTATASNQRPGAESNLTLSLANLAWHTPAPRWRPLATIRRRSSSALLGVDDGWSDPHGRAGGASSSDSGDSPISRARGERPPGGFAPEQCRPVFQRAGEYRLVVLQLGRHRGKGVRAVAPSRPFIRIEYKPGSVVTSRSCTPIR